MDIISKLYSKMSNNKELAIFKIYFKDLKVSKNITRRLS